MAGVTIIGAGSGQGVVAGAVYRVEIRAAWSAAWQTANELEILRMSAGSSQEIGELEVMRRYGAEVAQPYQTALQQVSLANLLNYWVRVRFIAQGYNEIVWVGRFLAERRNVHGSSSVPSGGQTFVAYEPLRLLQRIYLEGSYWPPQNGLLADTRLQWTPTFNSRDPGDRGGKLRGNRSAAISNGTYIFGGKELWSRRQMADYLLERFADETVIDPDTSDPVYDPVGPLWVLGGQAALLDNSFDAIEPGNTLAEALSRVIAPEIGADFKIAYLEGNNGDGEGFEVVVSSLAARATSFGGRSFPANSRPLRITASTNDQATVTNLVRTHDQRYRRIRVVGRRVIACCTLEGSDVEKKWPQSLEDLYLRGADLSGSTDEDKQANDLARHADRFTMVFQAFGAVPSWEYNDFTAFPDLDNEGEFFLDSSPAAPQFQQVVRRTLSWLPFREAVDYTADPPVDSNVASAEPEFLAPQAWVKDQELNRYVPADSAGLYVSALEHEWGLLLNGDPNHIMAREHWAAAFPSMKDPKYSYDELVLTIAFETDRRLELVYQEPDWRPSDGEMVIDADAELWFAAPDTVWSVDKDGNFLRTPGSKRTVLRNDATHLYQVMAGAISRYAAARCRAEVVFAGLQPHTAMVGQMLTVVEGGQSDSIEINAPVTGVEWDFGTDPRTVLRAGFAR